MPISPQVVIAFDHYPAQIANNKQITVVTGSENNPGSVIQYDELIA